MSELTAPHFQDPDKAREYLERIRWPNGPVCPHCGLAVVPHDVIDPGASEERWGWTANHLTSEEHPECDFMLTRS